MFGYGFSYKRVLPRAISLSDEASAFILAHQSATGTMMGAAQKSAVNTLVDMLQGNGTTNGSDLWTNSVSVGAKLWIFCPSNDTTIDYAGCKIELFSAQTKGAFNNFLAGDLTVNGLTGGATKYFDSSADFNDYTVNDSSAFFMTNNFSVGGLEWGSNSASGGGKTWNDVTGGGTNMNIAIGSSTTNNIAVSLTAGNNYLLGGQRTDANTVGGFINGSLTATSTRAVNIATSNNVYFHCRNNDGTASDFNTSRMIAYGIGMGSFTANQVQDLYECLETFNKNIITGGRWLDEDAKDFITAHETATGASMALTQRAAVDGFVRRLKGEFTTNGSNLWTQLVSKGSHIWTLTPTDDSTATAAGYAVELVSAATVGSFVNFLGTDITPTGVDPNNTNTKYFETGLAPSTFSSNDEYFGVYNRTAGVSSNYDMGSYNGSTQAYVMRIEAASSQRRLAVNSFLDDQTLTGRDGLILAGRAGGTFGYSWVDGAVDTTHPTLSGTTATNTFRFHRANGISTVNANREFAMYLLDIPTWTANEWTDFVEAVDWYQQNVITGGRNV